MTNDTRSPEEIEREIERERAGLTNTLDDLQDKFSVETIARQFSDQFREHGGDIGRSVSDAVKRNPVALALTGVGLAWLMMGDKTGSGDRYRMNLDPTSSLADVFEGRCKIAVLSPHPDDESLACGALLARAFSGAGAHVFCLTDGSASHPNSRQWPSERLAHRRKAELTQAIKHLGGSTADLTWLGMKDARLYLTDPVATARDLAELIADSSAQHVFAPAPQDHHEDHKATASIADEIRRLRPDWSFYSYPVWSRWDDPDFDQNTAQYAPHYMTTGEWQKQKCAAITAHRSQMGAVVTDDPDGFVLPSEFVEKFVTEDEIFWRMS